MPCNYKNYPKNWKSEIRPDILKRANNCCEECGVKNGMAIFRGVCEGIPVYQTITGDLFQEDGTFIMKDSEYALIECTPPNKKAIRVVLTISHTDHDTTNNDYGNLKALCQLHHLRYDAVYHKQTKRKNKGLQELF